MRHDIDRSTWARSAGGGCGFGVGSEVRAARVNRGRTLAEVGAVVGVSVSTESRLERGVLEHVT